MGVVQAHWVGQGWQSAVYIIDLFLFNTKAETATLFGGLACPMLNNMLASGDEFVQGVAARIVQGVVKHDAAVLLASGLDLASLVQLLRPSSTLRPIKQLVAFILAKACHAKYLFALHSEVLRPGCRHTWQSQQAACIQKNVCLLRRLFQGK